MLCSQIEMEAGLISEIFNSL